MNIETVDLNKFRTFYHVANSASFTKAAENLHMSQSTLSRSIASLEESLKMRLFERSRRGVVPTPEGKELLKMVHSMFDSFLSYEEKVKKTYEDPEGLLKISIASHLPTLKISQKTSEFLGLFPQMRLAFIDKNQDDGFNTYQSDATIQQFQPYAKNMEQVYLTTASMGLYASAAYLERYGVPEKEKDLQDHLLIALGNPDNLPNYSVNKILDIGTTGGKKWVPSLCVMSLSEMTHAVQSGLGIALLPTEYGEGHSSLVRVLSDVPPFSFDLYYAYPKYHQNTKRVTTYGEFLAKNLRPPLYVIGK